MLLHIFNFTNATHTRFACNLLDKVSSNSDKTKEGQAMNNNVGIFLIFISTYICIPKNIFSCQIKIFKVIINRGDVYTVYPKIFLKCRTILSIFAEPRIFKKRLLMEHYWKEAYDFTSFSRIDSNSQQLIQENASSPYKEKKY